MEEKQHVNFGFSNSSPLLSHLTSHTTFVSDICKSCFATAFEHRSAWKGPIVGNGLFPLHSGKICLGLLRPRRTVRSLRRVCLGCWKQGFRLDVHRASMIHLPNPSRTVVNRKSVHGVGSKPTTVHIIAIFGGINIHHHPTLRGPNGTAQDRGGQTECVECAAGTYRVPSGLERSGAWEVEKRTMTDLTNWLINRIASSRSNEVCISENWWKLIV